MFPVFFVVVIVSFIVFGDCLQKLNKIIFKNFLEKNNCNHLCTYSTCYCMSLHTLICAESILMTTRENENKMEKKIKFRALQFYYCNKFINSLIYAQLIIKLVLNWQKLNQIFAEFRNHLRVVKKFLFFSLKLDSKFSHF